MELMKQLPIGVPLAEHQMIGRESVISGIERRISNAEKPLLLEPVSTGRTSVSEAAVLRKRRDGVGITVDLDAHETAAEVTAALAEQACAQLVAVARRGDGCGWLSHAGAHEAAAADQIAWELQGCPTPGALLERVASAVPAGHTAVSVDNAERLKSWPVAARRELRTFLRSDARMGVIFVSTTEEAATGLLGPGQPLDRVGQRYPMPDIADEDWATGLRDRLGNLGIAIERPVLDRLLDESCRHPYCTVLLARECAIQAAELGKVTAAVVESAVESIRGNHYWPERLAA